MTLIIKKPGNRLVITAPDGGVIRADVASSTILIAAGTGPQGPPGPQGDGITAEEHEDLDTLTHGLAETTWEELVYTGSDLTEIIVWTSPAKLLRVRDTTFTYAGGNLTTVVTRQYDDLGALTKTLTKVFTYSGKDLVDIDTVPT